MIVSLLLKKKYSEMKVVSDIVFFVIFTYSYAYPIIIISQKLYKIQADIFILVRKDTASFGALTL